MSTKQRGRRSELRRLIDGFKLSQVLGVIASAGIADVLADGERTSIEIAAMTGLNAEALYRLLRAAASAGILDERPNRTFKLTELGQGLRTEVADSLAGWAEYMCGSVNWRNWGNLFESVRTGRTAYEILDGVDAWTYRSAHRDLQALFDRAMVSSTATESFALVDAYPFDRFGTIIDVGGGRGAFLASVLERHESTFGVLFDQPHVVEDVLESIDHLVAAGRCRVERGSFFEAIPGGGDLYVLKSVIHDWDDEEAIRILKTCRRSMPSHAVVILAERILEPPNEGLDNKLSDLNMLVNPGGMERTQDEYAHLLNAAGLVLTNVIQTQGMFGLIEAASR